MDQDYIRITNQFGAYRVRYDGTLEEYLERFRQDLAVNGMTALDRWGDVVFLPGRLLCESVHELVAANRDDQDDS